jgi:hypothetical protein
VFRDRVACSDRTEGERRLADRKRRGIFGSLARGQRRNSHGRHDAEGSRANQGDRKLPCYGEFPVSPTSRTDPILVIRPGHACRARDVIFYGSDHMMNICEQHDSRPPNQISDRSGECRVIGIASTCCDTANRL